MPQNPLDDISAEQLDTGGIGAAVNGLKDEFMQQIKALAIRLKENYGPGDLLRSAEHEPLVAHCTTNRHGSFSFSYSGAKRSISSLSFMS
jgi:hypothetical protein